MSHEEDKKLTRHEEQLVVGKREVPGSVRARKTVETRHVSVPAERRVEELGDVERVRVDETDSGEIETLPDGSISIPVLEEELVITKRVVVRERVILRKHVTTETQRIEADLRRERVSIEGDVEET